MKFDQIVEPTQTSIESHDDVFIKTDQSAPCKECGDLCNWTSISDGTIVCSQECHDRIWAKAHEAAAPQSVKAMTKDEWVKQGESLFGDNPMLWRFKCPACGFIQSPQDYMDAGAPESAIAFSCVGRWRTEYKEAFDTNDKRPIPCNYAGGGLFKFNPIQVDDHQVFEFAPQQDAVDQ